MAPIQMDDYRETTHTWLLPLGLAFSLFVLGNCVLLAGIGLTTVAVRVSEQERCQSLVPVVRQCQPSSWNPCFCWWVWEEPPVMMFEEETTMQPTTDWRNPPLEHSSPNPPLERERSIQ